MQDFAGIDVAKDSFDLHLLSSRRKRTFEMSLKDIHEAVRLLQEAQCKLVVLEATGGYERCLAAELHHANIPIAIINPRQVRDFARAKGILAKTDAIDAYVLACFAKAIQPPPQQLPTELEYRLKDLVARRHQILALREAERCRDDLPRDPLIRKSTQAILRTVERQLAKIEHAIDQAIIQSPLWQLRAKIIDSVPGVGPATVRAVIAHLPELGQLNRRQIAALVGLAPMNNDSGKLKGKRSIQGGRPYIRQALYMAALAAISFNQVIKTYYQRLLSAGKKPMVALIAAERKLLTILNTLVRKNELWNPKEA